MKKIIIIVLSVLILLGGVGAGVYLVQQQQEFREKAQPATTLSLVTNNPTPNVGDNFAVSISIDTGENQVVGTQFYISYDSSRVKVNEVSPGTFFTNPTIYQSTIDEQNGLITYILYLPLGSQAAQGQGTVAAIDFEALDAGSTTISFDSRTTVGAFQEETNVLVGTAPLTVNVLGTAVPTNTQTPSPTETESNQENITATQTPTPTTTTASGQGGAATNTPTLTPTKTPTPTSVGGSDSQSSTNTPTTSFSESSGVDELPDSGIGGTTLILIVFGVLLFVFSFALI